MVSFNNKRNGVNNHNCVGVLKTNPDLLQRGNISGQAAYKLCGVFQITGGFWDGEILQTEQNINHGNGLKHPVML